jgi:HNH endonuclease
MTKPKPLPNREILLQLLEYNPTTGIFRWKTRGSPRFDGKLAGKRAGWVASNGYRYVGISSSDYKAARLAWMIMTGQEPPDEVDHKNNVMTDDRWPNLRDATSSQNKINRAGTAPLRGAHRRVVDGRVYWMARIKIHGKQTYLGNFKTAEAAHAAYCAASTKHHGSFARHR